MSRSNYHDAAVLIRDHREGPLVCVACLDRCREPRNVLCVECDKAFDNEVEISSSQADYETWVKSRRHNQDPVAAPRASLLQAPRRRR